MLRGQERSPARRTGGLISVLALVPGVTGLATAYWLRDGLSLQHVGLWQICSGISCQSLPAEVMPDWYNLVRGLCVMALCLHVISVVTGCCCSCTEPHDYDTFTCFPSLEEATALIAGLLSGTGLLVFVRFLSTHPVLGHLLLDWGFWMSVLHVLLLLLSALLIALSRHYACAVCRKWAWLNRKLGQIPDKEVFVKRRFDPDQSPKLPKSVFLSDPLKLSCDDFSVRNNKLKRSIMSDGGSMDNIVLKLSMKFCRDTTETSLV